MDGQTNPSPAEDSLDRVERLMAIEEAIIQADSRLTPEQRERLMREIEALIAHGEFGDEGDFDDDALAALVRKLGPRSPRGQAGAAAQPEDPFFEEQTSTPVYRPGNHPAQRSN
jgi:hypothetical protein